MTYYIINGTLAHHGVLGQKWGVRRYQNPDGTLTAAGKKKYNMDSKLGAVGRAITNGSMGQRLWGVGTNKGYREDRKEIKSLYKEKKKKIEDSDADKQSKKDKLDSLKSDYKKTKGEARISAAEVLYSHQSTAVNTMIQTQHLGKQYAKNALMGSYGALNYDRLRASGYSKLSSAAAGIGSDVVNNVTYGAVSIGDHTANRVMYNRKNKNK